MAPLAQKVEDNVRKSACLILAVAALVCAPISAQQKLTGVTPADYAAVANAKASPIHIFRALTAAGSSYREFDHAGVVPNTAVLPGPGIKYPADLTNQGGPTIGNATFHAIYVESPAAGCTFANWGACWGNPENFLVNLGKSDFIHVTDPYVGRFDSNRYTNGPDGAITFGIPVLGYTFTDADMQAIVHLFITTYPQNFQAGENQIYHVFLPPGTDECFDATKTECYSPDNPNTFFYCGYHSSVTFADIGHVVYTVEPYENVGGCNVAPGTPNGPVADGTANVLSHETFETITDPEGTAWWNPYDNGIYGEEIGDECSFLAFTSTGSYLGFNPSVFRINGTKYAVQPEYSNGPHACVTSPGD
jgi:hypothetical protein